MRLARMASFCIVLPGLLSGVLTWRTACAADPIEEPATSADESTFQSDGEIELMQRRTRASDVSVRPSTTLPAAATELSEDLLRKSQLSSDAGSLLDGELGVAIQNRTPIVHEPRTRGTRTGQLTARGSYWVPARQDLDTLLSKIDSGVVGDLDVIKGPYTALHGPGFSFIDARLVGAPRYENGLEWHGFTGLNFQTNGQQWSGRQTIMGGSTDWGAYISYGHRTGNDYETGDDIDIPSSYKSRDVYGVFGWDLAPDAHIEFSYLRLDQTDVEFPGQIFDIDFLVTDAYKLSYVLENQYYFDRLTFDTWYNRTRFEGNAQRAGKRRQIPQLDDPLHFFGETDVDSMSTGFRLATTWGDPDCPQLNFGADLRFLKQELNEFDAFEIPDVGPSAGNFPIPRSHSSNPGLFVEQILPLDERLVLKTGARVDWVSTNTEGSTAGRSRAELLRLLGGEEFDRDFNLWSAYITAEYKVDDHWTALGGFGHAERPPTLTELYAVDPFLAILQQGFTQVRGNLGLHSERLWQMDLGLKADYCRFRGGINGFYAWVHDYITYLARDDALANAVSGGLGVTFVNTDLATLSGGEMYGEYDWNDWLTPFARLSYVEGRDHSRDDRGIIRGSDEEPLPGIAPLESRIGLRFHDPCERPQWGIELAARIVDNQDRVASSLREKETPGFTTYELRGFWKATDRFLFVAGVENLTNTDYREHLDLRTGNGVFQPGVNFYFGVELNY